MIRQNCLYQKKKKDCEQHLSELCSNTKKNTAIKINQINNKWRYRSDRFSNNDDKARIIATDKLKQNTCTNDSVTVIIVLTTVFSQQETDN